MKRFSEIERLGVNAAERIVLKELGWIFREQPIVDVGIDAIIEQVENNNPTGKFIAVQVKTGKGNFYISNNSIIYYFSDIHYNYWINLDIPIIMIAHFPETEETIWQQISEKNITRSNKRWKLKLSRNQKLNKKAKEKLLNILSSKNKESIVFDLYKGVVEPDSLFDMVEKVSCLELSVETINNVISIIRDLKLKTDSFNSKLRNYLSRGLTDKNNEVKATYKRFGRDLNITSKRLNNEIELFSKLFSEGAYAFEQIIHIHYSITQDLDRLNFGLESINMLPPSIVEALAGIEVMKQGVINLPKKHFLFKDARKSLIDSINFLITELTISKEISENLIKNIHSININT